MSSSGSNSEIVMELAEEFLDRYRRGERPPLAEYTSQHPHLADEIREVFPAMAMMENIAIDDESLAAEKEQAVRVAELEQLGDYRIIREAGRGGMGVVYEAEQVSLGRHVALKVLPSAALPDSKHVRRFEREAKSAAKLHHTNIVPVFGVGEQDGMHYYVMQFIQGLPLDEVVDELKKIQDQPSGTLASSVTVGKTGSFERKKSVADVAHSLMTGQFAETYIGESDSEVDSSEKSHMDSVKDDSSASRLSETMNLSGSLSSSTLQLGKSGVHSAPHKQLTYWQSVANIGAQVADALHYAHEQGILHRDIKPSNLLLDLRGTTWVTDFGLAKATDQQDITHTGDILGTLRYMPPEAFDGIADARSDVYSLGLTMYELLAFQPAFGVKERHQLIKQVTSEAAPRLDKLNPNIPRDLVTIVHKAIDRDPAHRYQTAEELREDLHRFLEDEPIKARRISLTERVVRWSRRNRGLAASLATVCVLLLIINIAGPLMYLKLMHSNEQLGQQKDKLDRNIQELQKSRERESWHFRRTLKESKAKEEAIASSLKEKEQKLIAQEKLERDIYSGDILQAALEAQRGNLPRMREILLAYIPTKSDETDLRGPEWYYWWNFLHQSEETGRLDAGSGQTVPQVVILPGGDLVAVAGDDSIQIFHRTPSRFDLMGEPSYSVPTTMIADTVLRNPMTASGLILENVNATGPGFAETAANRNVARPRSLSEFEPPQDIFHAYGSNGQSQKFKFPPDALQHLSFLAVSPDERLVAALGVSTARSEDPICRTLVWSVETGEQVADLPYEGELTRIKFNHDGTLLAAYLAHGSRRRDDGERNVVVVYELPRSGEQTEPREIVARHNDDIDSVYFFPDRREMLLGTLGYSNNLVKELYRWTIDDTDPVRLGEETLPDLGVGEISPDGDLFAISGRDIATIRLIDTSTGKTVKTLYNSEGFKISSLTFSSQGDRLIACGKTEKSAAVLEWAIESPDLFALIQDPITLPASFSPSSIYLPEPIYAVSPDQSLLAYFGDQGLVVRHREEGDLLRLNVKPERILSRFSTIMNSLAFSRDNRWLAVSIDLLPESGSSQRHQLVEIYDLESKQKIFTDEFLKQTYIIPSAMSFTVGRQLIFRLGTTIHVIDVNDREPKRVHEFSLAAQLEKQRSPGGFRETINRLKFFSRLVTDPQATQVMFADLEPPQETADENEIGQSTESRDGMEGRWRLRVLDAVSGKEIHSIELPLEKKIHEVEADLQAIVLAPGGRRVGIIWNDHTEIWDLRAEGGAWVVPGNDLVFSPDGSLLAAMSRDDDPNNSFLNLRVLLGLTTRIDTVTLWDVAAKTELSTISLTGSGTDDIRFSPNAQRLLTLHGLKPSGSADVAAEARLWDVRSGRELLSFPVEKVNHYYWDVAFDPASQDLTSLTSIVFGKYSTGRDSSVATAYDLSHTARDREITLVAQSLVDRLFEDYQLKQEVRRRLTTGDQYVREIRDKAEELIDKRADKSLGEVFNDCLTQIVERSQFDADRYQKWAMAFENSSPGDPRSKLMRGIAEFYSGNTDQALQSLAPEVPAGEQAAVIPSSGHDLVRQAYRILALLRDNQFRPAEREAMGLYRAIRRDFGFNCFSDDMYTIEIASAPSFLSPLVTQVQRELENHDCLILGRDSSPRQMAENMMFVLDLNADGMLTAADDSPAWEAENAHDWDTLSRLDSDGDERVSVDELETMLAVAIVGLDYPSPRINSNTRSMLQAPLRHVVWRGRASLWRDSDIKEYDRALADCEVSLRLAPEAEQVDILNTQGLIYYHREEYSTAIALFKKINKLDPEYSPGWNNQGICLAKLGKHREAISYYSEAIRLNANTINLNNRGSLYLKLGELENALKDFDELVRLEPKSSARYEKRGDVHLDLKNYQLAIDDFHKALELDSGQNSYREKLVRAYTLNGDYDQAADWFVKALDYETDVRKRLQLVQKYSELDVDFSQALKDRPEYPLLPAARESSDGARQLAADQLAASPDAEIAAGVLATVMRNALEREAEWTVLDPNDVKSSGGATLTKLADGSILAGGPLPEDEVYTLTAQPGLANITCIALETLPHETLPHGNSGRDTRLGNFLISQFKVAILDDASETESREIPIRRVCSDFAGRGGAKSSWVENMLESTAGKHWTAWPDVHISHRIVFELQEPIAVPENGALRITIDCVDRKYPQHALGRFRVSASDSSTAFEQERQRLAVFKIEDAWEQLAAVYHLAGNDTEKETLLARRPEAALGITAFLAETGHESECTDYLNRVVEHLRDAEFTAKQRSEKLRACGALFARAGQWQQAAQAYAAGLELNPEANSIDWMKVGALFAYADDAAGHAKFCREMSDHFSKSTQPADAERTLKVMLLMDSGLVSGLDPEQVPVKPFLDALAGNALTTNYRRWFLSTRALLACRADEFGGLAEAQQWLDDSKGESEYTDGYVGLLQRSVQALILAKQGKSDEARQLLDELTSKMRTDFPVQWDQDGQLHGSTVLNGNAVFHDLMIPEILRREAERLLQDQAGNSTTR